MNKNITVVLVLVLAAGCATYPQSEAYPPMDPERRVSVQVCTRQVDTGDGGNLLCRDETEADRRASVVARNPDLRLRPAGRCADLRGRPDRQQA